MSEKQDKVQKVRDVTLRLIEARSLLAAGWIQKKAHRDGSYCIVGAIYSEYSGAGRPFCPDWREDSIGVEAEAAVEKLIRPLPAPGFCYIAEWNDKPGRTQAEVLHLMDTAIGNSMSRG